MSEGRKHRPDWMGFILPLTGLVLIIWWMVDRSGPLLH
jgi:hypothetical protein